MTVLPQRLAELVPAARRRDRVAAALLVLVLLALLGAGAAFAAGFRWFVVETPSMAETAPVGTLVVTAPTHGRVRVGQVVSFRPPGVDRVYTHRVVEVLADGAIRTRGDLNGADDAWTTPPARIVGTSIALLPALGFLVRGLPLLILGLVLLRGATSRIRRADRRAAARVVGAHAVAALLLLHLHPLVAMHVVATETDQRITTASVVSTGLLPIAITADDGVPLARLSDGQLAVVPLQPTATAGRFALQAALDLPPWEHALLVALGLLPAVVVLLTGLPRADQRPEAA